jgi:hypothetical protein
VPALLTQTAHLSPRDLLRLDRSLTHQEIEGVLEASREALSAKTFQLMSVGGQAGPDILMGGAGRPKIIRWTGAIEGGVVGPSRPDGTPLEMRYRREYIRIVEYTGRPAPHCTRSTGGVELVVEYERDRSSTRWTATARARDARDFGGPGLAPMFEIVQGQRLITSGEQRRIKGRSARAMVSPWKPPAHNDPEPPFLRGDPVPNVRGEPLPDDGKQLLWIDTASLLPLRWEAFSHGSLAYSFDLVYRNIALRTPAGVKVTTCGP